MIFGPNYNALLLPLGITIPAAFLLSMFGFRWGSGLSDTPASWTRTLLATLLQWAMIVPLQFIFGWLLAIVWPEAWQLIWLVVLTAAIPMAAALSAWLVLRVKPRQIALVSAVNGVVVVCGTCLVFWVTLNAFA